MVVVAVGGGSRRDLLAIWSVGAMQIPFWRWPQLPPIDSKFP